MLARFALVAILAGAGLSSAARAEDSAAPAASEHTNFLGTWKVKDGSDRVFFITIKPDGLATSRWEDPAEARRNQQGTWKALEGGVVILWANGWRETLTAGESGVVKRAYAPKLTLGGHPSNETPAERASTTP